MGDRLNSNILRMQFFYIKSTYETYEMISNYFKNSKSGDRKIFNIWELAVLVKLNKLSNTDLIKVERKIHKTITLLKLNPDYILLNKVWYIFFATGNPEILKILYEVSENPRASEKLKIDSRRWFELNKSNYRKKINALIIKDVFDKAINTEDNLLVKNYGSFDFYKINKKGNWAGFKNLINKFKSDPK